MEQNEVMFDLAVEDGVALLTMQAPGNNLMTGEFFAEFEPVMEKLENLAAASEIKGIIICAKGRHFSVGADVKSLAERSSADLEHMKSDYDFSEGHIRQKHLVTFLNDLSIPVISAVTGFAIGSGSEIAVNSHIRVCDKTARVGQPESTFDILPGLGGVARTASMCGLTTAFELVMSGELIPAQQAYNIGWAHILTEKKQALPTAKRLMEKLLAMPEGYDRALVPKYIAQFAEEVTNG